MAVVVAAVVAVAAVPVAALVRAAAVLVLLMVTVVLELLILVAAEAELVCRHRALLEVMVALVLLLFRTHQLQQT